MAKIASIGLAVATLAMAALPVHADLITSMEVPAAPAYVSCSGMAERNIIRPEKYPDSVSLTVDLANSTLTLENDGERFPITSAFGYRVTVNSRGNWGDVSILLNRVTGKLSIEIFNDKGQLVWDFAGYCESAVMTAPSPL